jgi:hypothetical protein
MFDYTVVPALNVSGGILLGWHREAWSAAVVTRDRYSLFARLVGVGSQVPWLITVVYGPQLEHEKVEFLEELCQFREANAGPWLLCGDFNMIYQAADKSNERLDRRAMRRFRSFINEVQLQEVDLIGRCFTWSNEWGAPTLERLDRVLASVDWFDLKALSSDCSDHCPLLLLLDAVPRAKRRFRFESFWVKLPGFLEVVEQAWSQPVMNVDPFRLLDYKLRHVAKALQRWSGKKIGSVRLQLAMAREVILRLDEAKDFRMLLALYHHYNSILGTSFGRSRRVNLAAIGLPSLELSDLEVLFTEDEVRSVVMSMPNDKAPGPDSFTGLFYKVA